MAEPSIGKERNNKKPTKRIHKARRKKVQQQRVENPQSWGGLRNFFSCKDQQATAGKRNKRKSNNGCSVSLCNCKDSSRVMQRPDPTQSVAHKKWASSSSLNGSNRSMKAHTNETKGVVVSTSNITTSSSSSHSFASLTTSSSTSSSSLGGSFRGMHLRRLSGCYECHMVVGQINGFSRVPSLRASVLPCPDCGEVFVKSESLELHQSLRHAFSELGPEDTSRNIVEIIFQSSWLKKQPPVCKIERILKVHNTQKTVSRFEDYRDSIKSKAAKVPKKHPRCAADGNELLRFSCAAFTCSLGVDGSTGLCHSVPRCMVCEVLKDGFKTDGDAGGSGVRTTATSGRAHDAVGAVSNGGQRAMIVCRVIAGRVRRGEEGPPEECDSIGGGASGSGLDELMVFNPRAILPCFVVVYSGY